MSDSEYITPDKYGAVNPDKTLVKVCCTCGFPFETSRMIRYKGKYYCKPNDCYRDLKGIRKKSRGNRK